MLNWAAGEVLLTDFVLFLLRKTFEADEFQASFQILLPVFDSSLYFNSCVTTYSLAKKKKKKIGQLFEMGLDNFYVEIVWTFKEGDEIPCHPTTKLHLKSQRPLFT